MSLSNINLPQYQPLFDEEGNPPRFMPGTEVVYGSGQKGRVIRQELTYDSGETFWGNIYVELEDGQLCYSNTFQVRKVEEAAKF